MGVGKKEGKGKEKEGNFREKYELGIEKFFLNEKKGERLWRLEGKGRTYEEGEMGRWRLFRKKRENGAFGWTLIDCLGNILGSLKYKRNSNCYRDFIVARKNGTKRFY